jgi:prephenate dehydratase
VRVAYLGPAGTFSQEALLASPGASAWEALPQPSVYDAVLAVHDGAADRALVPIENSLEGSVNATLDALAFEADDVVIVGELVHPVRHCLIAREAVPPESIRTVVSHPQASGQCARFIRTRLGAATVVPAASTADAVRLVAEGDLPAGTPAPHAALGNRLAAELYGCEVILDGVEDAAGNATRFIWVAPRADSTPSGPAVTPSGPAKTSLVFWGAGSVAPGWLVRCLSEFAFRGVNLTRIESRPLKQGLGSYVFFLDCEGSASAGPVADAIEGLRGQAEVVRVLGSYPVAA